MLKKYKKNFILLNMLLIGTTLFLMLSIIFIYLHYTSISDLKTTMSQLTRPVKNSDDLPDAPPEPVYGKELLPEEPAGPKASEEDGPESKADSKPPKNPKKYEKAITIFFYDAASGDLFLLSRSFITDEETFRAIADKIASYPEPFGRLTDNKMYFYKTQTGKIFRIAVADSAFIRNSSIKIFVIILVIYICAMLIFYFISIRFSEYAVRPLEAEMKREKQFVADTSHDLKTPIAVILANTAILQRNKNAFVEEMVQWVDSTEAAARKMQLLVEEMLVLSEVEAAGDKIDMESIDISDVAEMLSLFMEPVAYEKNIRYQMDISEHIVVYGNRNYIQRIFQAFIENAIKYEPAGGEVSIALFRGHGRAVFSVHNKLSVISEEDLPHIFERFYRSDKSRQSNGGHGLGLAIAKSMADVMHARTEVESSEQTGTTFRIFFYVTV